jgi:acylphosphatase
VPDQKQAKRFYISGQVQGVGYRYFAQGTAERLGLAGYAKNRADGRVEVYAVGTQEQLHAFLGELRQGPRHTVVERVEEADAELLPAFSSGFSIEYDN